MILLIPSIAAWESECMTMFESLGVAMIAVIMTRSSALVEEGQLVVAHLNSSGSVMLEVGKSIQAAPMIAEPFLESLSGSYEPSV